MFGRKLNEREEIVLTLDAGGTNFVFSAIQGGNLITEEIRLPSNAHDLDLCLKTIFEGFEEILTLVGGKADAISFAFPGPADYKQGIIGKLGNLPAFKEGGVPLGPILKEKFGLPVFINNDGDLFAYGEAIAGFLPQLNNELQKAGNPLRYRNLLAFTFGTGFGAGIVSGEKLHIGDNSAGAEIFLMRNPLNPKVKIEEEISIRGIKRFFAEAAKIPFEEAPEPKEIFKIGMGIRKGNQEAAIAAFKQFGKSAGEAIANAVTLLDAPIVLGGGISKAHPLFLRTLVETMNGYYESPDGTKERRLIQKVFNFEEETSRNEFLKNKSVKIPLKNSSEEIYYNAVPQICVGVTKLGTSRAIMLGAYAFALEKLSK